MKIVVFDAKPYDIEFFDKWNETFGANITYFEEKLSLKNVMLTKYQDVVCTFVNDDLNAKVLNILSKNGVRVVAARCAGYNNIDLKAARENRITVLRVPAYSPYAVAEHSLALLMSVNRKTHKAYNIRMVCKPTLEVEEKFRTIEGHKIKHYIVTGEFLLK